MPHTEKQPTRLQVEAQVRLKFAGQFEETSPELLAEDIAEMAFSLYSSNFLKTEEFSALDEAAYDDEETQEARAAAEVK